ncbi:MAG: 3-hydroxyacyl-CoA dehydrogenase family protein, partial [Bacteroidales bacterium]|nr:3-hydroxyacyl-CoA dehydrogenase family protein [Bacteroidales bacterium]
MNYADKLRNVTIIGAAGKMGSGIVLLTALELAKLSLTDENRDKSFVLNALDLNEDSLKGLMGYLNTQVSKLAEKKFDSIKGFYPNISDEKKIQEQYVKDVLSIVNTTSNMGVAKDSTLIFEAAVENPELKIKIFNQMEEINTNKPVYFTNTSSIPIHLLNNESNLEGRVVGVHFYNPPAVQRLVELIPCSETHKEVLDFANTFAKNLRKVVVFSNDIAAFVGNGHFTRDILFAANKVKELSNEMSTVEAIYIMDKISREYLIRPMGIFQLCDYVGIDVCFNILKVMAQHIEGEDLHSELLAQLMDLKVIGGQNSDGSAKDGIMKYEKGRPVAIFDVDKN